MALSPEDALLLADMKQRELHLKRRQRAADRILHGVRRYRAVLSVVAAALFSLLVVGAVGLYAETRPGPVRWHLALPVIGGGVFVGMLVGQKMWDTRRGRTLLANKEGALRRKHSGDLHAGRRWLQFYYDGEDVSAFVPQILYFIESEQRFDSIRDALEFAKSHHHESHVFAKRAHELFDSTVAQVNEVVLSSTDDTGRPSSRIMRFVTTDRPGVWYVTTAPQGPKVPELDRGRIALVTSPTEAGATITSNRVRVRRAGVGFREVIDLYRDQVPGYLDGMTEEDQDRELVYELTLRSARVDTWLDHELVVFEQPTTNLD